MISNRFGDHGVFFVLFPPVASICNPSHPFPSPWSPSRRPEHSKHEKLAKMESMIAICGDSKFGEKWLTVKNDE